MCCTSCYAKEADRRCLDKLHTETYTILTLVVHVIIVEMLSFGIGIQFWWILEDNMDACTARNSSLDPRELSTVKNAILICAQAVVSKLARWPSDQFPIFTLKNARRSISSIGLFSLGVIGTANDCNTPFTKNVGSYYCPSSKCNYKKCAGCFFKNYNEFKYESYAFFEANQSSNLRCSDCQENLKWFWDSNQSNNPNTIESFVCQILSRKFPSSAGTFCCVPCQKNVCTGCYSTQIDSIIQCSTRAEDSVLRVQS